jgi:NAD(P)-dependent dehydrogenase (short-subunit alcohol dehydrogenase family)
MTGRDESALDRARAEIGAAAGHLMSVPMDVTNPASIEEAHRTIVQRFARVDVLVNNAAVLLFEESDVLSIPDEGFRRTLDTNLLGVIEACRVFVPPMANRRYGRIVNVSSGAGQLSRMSTYAPAYSISKAALNAFTRILAATYRAEGLLVNVVDPGWVRTDMGGRSAPRSVEQGAETIVWAATLPEDGPTGGFFRDRRQIDW